MEVDDTNPEEEPLSIEELRDKLNAEPDDQEIMEDLAIALMYRHMDGEEDYPADNDLDLEQLRSLSQRLQPESILYVRAYLAYIDDDNDATIECLEKWVRQDSDEALLSADEIYELSLDFPGLLYSFFGSLGERLATTWPDSPMTATLRAWGKVENEPLEAKRELRRALETDSEYWIAAWELAEILAEEKLWDEAERYYSEAGRSEYARGDSDFLFDYASCLWNLKKFKEEGEMYRACLEIDPDYPYARNNLGYSLYRQGRYEEALELFEECIRQQVDGAYPVQNKARTLKMLGRYQEAIDTWKLRERKGKLPKTVEIQISRLEKLIEKQEQHN